MPNRRRWVFASAAALAAAAVVGGAFAPVSSGAPAPDVAAANAAAVSAAADVGRVATINAFLNQHCVACHGPTKHKADLTLHTFTDQPAILKGRKTFQTSLKMVHAGEMPPDAKPRPTAAEMDAFFAAVDGLFDNADKTAKPDPGRVTVRRLNKTEYNNTIRDLLGVDPKPADDFPADDIGHGFDNIGDVLTVSPVLMERYLAAAEGVAAVTILTEPPKISSRWEAGKELRSLAGSDSPRGRRVPVANGNYCKLTDDLSTAGTTIRLSVDGDYTFRAKVYGRRAAGGPVRATLLVDGKPLQTFDVTGTDERSAKNIEAKVSLAEAGEHRFDIALAPDAGGTVAEKAPAADKAADARAEADLVAKLRERRQRELAKSGKGAAEPPTPAGGGASPAKAESKAVEAAKNDGAKADAKQTDPKKPDATSTDAKKADAKKSDAGTSEPRGLYVEHLNLSPPANTLPKAHRRIIALADPAAPRAAQTRQILTKLVSRAYRRPATPDEVERLAKLVDGAEAAGDKWEAGLQMALQAILVSPKFLFRLELDDRPDSPELRPLDDYALASRISYFLWSSMPDDELFALAAKGELSANVEPQVKRMLQDPRAQSLVDNFAMQWLQLKRLKGFQPDPATFPTFDEQLRVAMGRETELFIGAVVKEDRSILDLLDADFTFLNERLARHYGIADTNGNALYQKADRPAGDRIPREQFVRVQLPPGGARGGILTQASVLTVTSNPTRTSPVKRGKWVLEQVLGTPPPPPPPDVPELEEKGKAATATSLRQRLELHRANPACAGCHAKMDPLGFAFENFDAIGAFRQKDGNFDIDPSGVLPDGRKINGPAELKSVLKEKKDLVAKALTEKLLTYALGRGLEFYDDRAVTKIDAAIAPDNYRFSRLVTEIVKSEPFRLRRGLDKE
jgi:mono/diheme cytochrome c family protein